MLQAILVVKLQNLIVSVCGSMSYLTKTKEVILYFILLNSVPGPKGLKHIKCNSPFMKSQMCGCCHLEFLLKSE